MGSRVNHIDVVINIYHEFAGSSDLSFTYEPTSDDDPFVAQVLEKYREARAKRMAAIDTSQGSLI